MSSDSKETIKMPHFLIYAKALFIGFLISESFFCGFYISSNFSLKISINLHIIIERLKGYAELPSLKTDLTSSLITYILPIGLFIFYIVPYLKRRKCFDTLKLILKRKNFRLLAIFTLGVILNYFLLPQLELLHIPLSTAPPFTAPTILIFFLITITSNPKPNSLPSKDTGNNLFVSDQPIVNKNLDLLNLDQQVKNFSEHILNAKESSELVFGVDGSWGVGKTSLINLLQENLEQHKNLVVCRFEPLRYSSNTNITNMLITEITAAIQKKYFTPELKSAASRYSRLIKGNASISFFGLKLSFSPTNDTIEDLLADIDDALGQLDLRIVIIIDDLDRLDPKSINNVLYATKQSFKLSRATYVLCYDTENIIGEHDDKSKAREFLEKFVSVKLNILIDTKDLTQFLRNNWQSDERLELFSAEIMEKVSSVLEELASLLEGKNAYAYLPLLGNFRKVKRFINSILVMQLHSSDLSKTDFNKQDLIHLVLIHLNYPGLFRQIYQEETSSLEGSFSLRKRDSKWKNSDNFSHILENQESNACFLLRQLFDVKVLKFEDPRSFRLSDEEYFSRACFNKGEVKNLEKLLKLIARCIKPKPTETYTLYKSSVDKIINGEMYSELLKDNQDMRTQESRDKLLNLLVSHSYKLDKASVDNIIDTLITQIQESPILFYTKESSRKNYILSLISILNKCGWGHSAEDRHKNNGLHRKEIAWRIFGSNLYHGTGILEKFISNPKGICGWQDLMLFRLYCCADRGGQFYNLSDALILEQDESAETAGLVSKLTIQQMRKISQEIFALFSNNYISKGVNFFNEIENTKEELPTNSNSYEEETLYSGELSASERIASSKMSIANFVIYHLSYKKGPDGSGIGCGFYDVKGTEDNNGIANLMNDYLFDVCFNPDKAEENALYFIDYCLSHLTSGFFSNLDTDDFVPTKEDIIKPLSEKKFREFWKKHKGTVIKIAENNKTRKVYTPNYIANYEDDLKAVLTTLDEILEEDNASDSGD
ncbi:KAP P-loop protein [Pseudoalteromonas sp. S1727]|uniref:P-loop NTPase fold protein n=1 Tax=Pseudoalteromonas sp. S1727 TaxID=2066514 RepID=UPI001108C8AB|nr:P-loop NTPase fold protein [Pseudoalteromonas sp. S1727]TMN71293.1 KAP P-loop protein [Pseudoalteromonas sp. S1727]